MNSHSVFSRERSHFRVNTDRMGDTKWNVWGMTMTRARVGLSDSEEEATLTAETVALRWQRVAGFFKWKNLNNKPLAIIIITVILCKMTYSILCFNQSRTRLNPKNEEIIIHQELILLEKNRLDFTFPWPTIAKEDLLSIPRSCNPK